MIDSENKIPRTTAAVIPWVEFLRRFAGGAEILSNNKLISVNF